MFELQFSRRFSVGHRLLRCGSIKCAVPHGHNEIVTMKLAPVEQSPLDGMANMVEPFYLAKRTWHEWIDDHVDHALHLADDDPLLNYFRENEPELLPRIMVFPGDPTTEALAACFKSKLNAILVNEGGRLECTEIVIEETPTNTVRFSGNSDLTVPSRSPLENWWQRADMSINDLDRLAKMSQLATAVG